MKSYNSVVIALLGLGACATTFAMRQAPLTQDDIRFIGGVPISPKSIPAPTTRLQILEKYRKRPSQKTETSTWRVPFSKIASYISSSYHTYQKNRAQQKLNQQFAQAVEKHIFAVRKKQKNNATSTLKTVRDLLAKGANPETAIVVPDTPFIKKRDDPFAANRGLFKLYSPPLYAAAVFKAHMLVEELVKRKADIDKGIGVSTPLREAISSGNCDTAAYVLLNNGANIYKSDRKDKHRLSLIWLSAFHNNPVLTIALLNRGARLECDTDSSDIRQSIHQALELQKKTQIQNTKDILHKKMYSTGAGLNMF